MYPQCCTDMNELCSFVCQRAPQAGPLDAISGPWTPFAIVACARKLCSPAEQLLFSVRSDGLPTR